jgi:hypothetical protein
VDSNYASTPFLPTWFRGSAQHSNTHTHTRKCTVANMCNGELCLQRCDRQRVLSAIAVPTSSPDSGRLGPRETRGRHGGGDQPLPRNPQLPSPRSQVPSQPSHRQKFLIVNRMRLVLELACGGDCGKPLDQFSAHQDITARTSPHDHGYWLNWQFCECHNMSRPSIG